MLKNAAGQPVSTQPVTIQIDCPCEQATEESAGSINIIAVVMAVVALMAALKSGDPTAIASAVQALIKAITGQ